jgi:hypothetical protein
VRYCPGIHDYPDGEGNELRDDERDPADEAADRVGDGLAAGTGSQGFAFDLDDWIAPLFVLSLPCAVWLIALSSIALGSSKTPPIPNSKNARSGKRRSGVIFVPHPQT